MGSSSFPYSFFRLKKTIFFRFFMILLLSSISHHRMNLCYNLPPAPADPSSLSNLGGSSSSSSYDVISSLKTIHLEGHLNFDNVNHAAKDFGNRHHYLPLAILHPKSVSDISSTIKHVLGMRMGKGLMGDGGTTVTTDEDQEVVISIAARGRGHSLQGQAQAHGGVVIDMESLDDHEQGRPKTIVHTGNGKMPPYADVCGGEVWINILHESLKYGLAPKSWTDYLHLTVGGTLSNAGISGQAFRHGPQINNVYQLEVVTGKGDIVTCSETQNADLFYGVLGGLGQFGIITRARISLEPAPKMVKWIRVLYSEFSIFSKDQEHLISSMNSFDYIEGFVLINRTGLLNNWRSSFNPREPLEATQFNSDGRTLYCLEMAKYFDPVDDIHIVNQVIDSLLSELSYIPSTLFLSEVSYVDFLDRVHVSEIELREKGLWEVPHPWLNLLIPKSRIHEFAKQVFRNILTNTANGPILIYPANQSKWNNRTSFVTPQEDIFYLVAFLSAVPPSPSTGTGTGTDGLESVITQNQRILDFCKGAALGMKQYLPHYTTQDEWQAHFGPKWQLLVKRKSMYDPLAILAPGQRIFQKATATPFSFRRILT